MPKVTLFLPSSIFGHRTLCLEWSTTRLCATAVGLPKPQLTSLAWTQVSQKPWRRSRTSWSKNCLFQLLQPKLSAMSLPLQKVRKLSTLLVSPLSLKVWKPDVAMLVPKQWRKCASLKPRPGLWFLPTSASMCTQELRRNCWRSCRTTRWPASGEVTDQTLGWESLWTHVSGGKQSPTRMCAPAPSTRTIWRPFWTQWWPAGTARAWPCTARTSTSSLTASSRTCTASCLVRSRLQQAKA